MSLFLLANATSDSKALSESLITHNDFRNTLYKLVDAPVVKIDLLKVVIWNINNLARVDLIDDQFLPLAVFICKVVLEKVTNQQLHLDALFALSSLTQNANNFRLGVIAQGQTVKIVMDTLNRSLNTSPVHMS